MRVTASVHAAIVPDDNPIHPVSTNLFLIGTATSGALCIDSGEDLDMYRWFLRGALDVDSVPGIGRVAITHHHNDHSGNLKWMNSEYGAEVMIPCESQKLVRKRVPKQYTTLEEGDTIEVEGARVLVLSTPGHTADSLCYYIEDEGILFAGDTVLGSSTTMVTDLAAYRRSLRRLIDLPNLKIICPGHGPIITDPRSHLTRYLDHRDKREREVMDALRGNGPMSSWQLMEQLYPTLHPGVRRMADNNVRGHLRQLVDEGRVKEYPGERQPKGAMVRLSPRAQAKRDAEDAIIRKAQRIEAARLRATKRMQQEPSPTEWVRPPLYELL